MLGYVLARIGQSAIVLLAVFSLVFWGVSILPADPAFVAKGRATSTPTSSRRSRRSTATTGRCGCSTSRS
nr:hypothetical protein [Mycobacterium lepraemurium]